MKGNYNNLYLATKIQVEIFKDNCALLEFLQCLLKVNNHTDFYLIYQKGELAGFVSFYDGACYGSKNEIWIGYFGILPKFRNNHIASQALLDFFSYFKSNVGGGYKCLRLCSYKKLKPALHIYRKYMDFEENYTRTHKSENMIVFTKSLTNKPAKKWNNRDLYYGEDKKYEKYSMIMWNSFNNKK